MLPLLPAVPGDLGSLLVSYLGVSLIASGAESPGGLCHHTPVKWLSLILGHSTIELFGPFAVDSGSFLSSTYNPWPSMTT